MILDKAETHRRNTRQRAALLELLKSVTCHPSAQWLYEQLAASCPGMSLATVYRNLSLLAKEGKIRTLHCAGDTVRFDGDIGIHYHVVCSQCGAIVDIPGDTGESTRLCELAHRTSGFVVSAHSFNFYGICPDCQSGNHTVLKDHQFL